VAPATFTAAQLRTFLRLLVQIDPYSFLEEVGSYFAGNDENTQQTDEEIILAALDSTADDKLTGFALRLVLTEHLGIPHQDQPDLLAEAEAVFAPAPPQPKFSKPKSINKSKKVPTEVKATKKTATKKAKAA
jgi:ParB family chromosome partitioning protein